MSSVPPAAPALTAEIRCQLRPGRIDTFRLRDDEVVLGRAPDVAVSIPVASVSRRHAQIRRADDAYWIENLSPAGTFVNCHRDARGRLSGLVARPRRLRHLDVITLGRDTDLLFLLYDAEQAAGQAEGIVGAALIPEGGSREPFELPLGETSIGRSSANNLVLENAAASALHARIERSARQLVVRDLDSRNGTFVNGERISVAPLRDGDRLSIADVVFYKVEIDAGLVDSAKLQAAARSVPEGDLTARRHSQAWKTRVSWNDAEMREIADLHERFADPAGPPAAPATRKERSASEPKTMVARPSPPPAPAADRPTAEAAPKAAPPAAPPRPAAKTAPVPVVPPKPATPEKPAAPLAEVSLLVQGLPEGERTLAVGAPGRYTIGRGSSADLRIAHPTVSRRQALVTLAADRSRAILEDAGSAHPVRVNGGVVSGPHTLAEGDTIEIGACRIVVRLRLERG